MQKTNPTDWEKMYTKGPNPWRFLRNLTLGVVALGVLLVASVLVMSYFNNKAYYAQKEPAWACTGSQKVEVVDQQVFWKLVEYVSVYYPERGEAIRAMNNCLIVRWQAPGEKIIDGAGAYTKVDGREYHIVVAQTPTVSTIYLQSILVHELFHAGGEKEQGWGSVSVGSCLDEERMAYELQAKFLEFMGVQWQANAIRNAIPALDKSTVYKKECGI